MGEQGFGIAGSCNDQIHAAMCGNALCTGCTYSGVCRYDAFATDAGDCTYADPKAKTATTTACIRLRWRWCVRRGEVPGCTEAVHAIIMHATDDDGSCTYPTESYLDKMAPVCRHEV